MDVYLPNVYDVYWIYFWTYCTLHTHTENKKNRFVFNATKRYKELIEEWIVVSGVIDFKTKQNDNDTYINNGLLSITDMPAPDIN